MAIAHKGAISFGMVHIPVNLYTATQDNDISFNQLHKEDSSRIRYSKICKHCGEEVKSEDIVKGYQYEKDKYVVISDADLEKIKTEKDKTIEIIHFAKLDEINSIYFDRAYHVLPEAGGDKALELLRQAMLDEKKIAIGKTVMGSRETLLAIMPREDGVILQTMFFADEIKAQPEQYTKPEVKKEELAMAVQLIDKMSDAFTPENFQDEYQEKLKELITKKIAGQEIVSPKEAAPDNIISLMDALSASLGKDDKPARKRKKKA